MARKQDVLPDFGPAIERLRRLVMESGDHLLLGDGPPHPDAKLLELCADAAEARKAFEQADKERHGHYVVNGQFVYPWERTPDQERARVDADATEKRAKRKLVHGLREATKIRATTAAGIFAKALAIRSSETGAICLAKSLAEDLVGNPALRAALWANDSEPATVPAPNVVPLHGRRP